MLFELHLASCKQSECCRPLYTMHWGLDAMGSGFTMLSGGVRLLQMRDVLPKLYGDILKIS